MSRGGRTSNGHTIGVRTDRDDDVMHVTRPVDPSSLKPACPPGVAPSPNYSFARRFRTEIDPDT